MRRLFAHAARATVLALTVAASAAHATPISVHVPFFNLEHRNVNSLGFGVGNFVRLGANSVVPNGTAGTTGVALRDDGQVARNLNFAPFPLAPNWFIRSFFDNPSLYRGNWTLRFTNGNDVANVPVYLDPSAQQAPFVNSITLSGSSLTPTFSWTPPPGATVHAYRVNIYDKAIITPTNAGNIVSVNLLPNKTSYTIDPADFTVPGYAFQEGRNYSIEISLIQTKDGTNNASNSNLQAIARSYADFTPVSGGSPVVNLPVVLEDGSYKFDIAVQPGVVYYIDPEVAIGYDYAIGAGDPLFQSVVLPDVGDGLFDIFGFDAGGDPFLLASNWVEGVTFDFGTGGIDRFRVLGIETSAGLDPANTTAFITGLTFTGPGQFTGTQTPITVTIDVPEPPVWTLALLGLLALRRQRPATV